MNIKYNLVKTKKNYKVAVRLYFRNFDLSLSLDLFLSSDKEWNLKSESFRDNPQANEKLLELKTTILKTYNQDFTRGVLIDKNWLKEVVKNVFNRPINEVNLINQDKDIYIVDFGNYWIKNFADSWKTSPKTTMSKLIKSQYQKLITILSRFEEEKRLKHTLSYFSQDDAYELINWLEEDGYNASTIDRYIGRLKFILNRASEMSLNVSQVRNQRIYVEKEDEIDGVFLDEFEINKILNKDFSFDPVLETTKDNFIIAIFTGMRSSDFLKNLDISNFKEGYIQITTQKTKYRIIVPIHKQVENVIKKYYGMLPPKQTNADFNKNIKILCQLCDIDNIMIGKIFNPKKKRKILGNYPKYKMITAHSLRRSFCTNMRGKISDDSLSKIMGWTTDELMSLYDKNSKLSHANKLKDFWNK